MNLTQIVKIGSCARTAQNPYISLAAKGGKLVLADIYFFSSGDDMWAGVAF